MNISVLNDSVQASIHINAEAAVNAIATNAAMMVYAATKFILDKAVEDGRKVYNEASKAVAIVADKAQRDTQSIINAGRTSRIAVEQSLNNSYSKAKANTIQAIADGTQTRDAIITATKIKAATAFQKDFVKPAQELKAQVVNPIKEQVAIVEEAIADYTNIKEVEAIAEKVSLDPIVAQNEINSAIFSEEWGHKAVEAAKNGHVLVGDKVITEDGVSNAIAVTEAVEEVQPRNASGLSEMIREEVAKH